MARRGARCPESFNAARTNLQVSRQAKGQGQDEEPTTALGLTIPPSLLLRPDQDIPLRGIKESPPYLHDGRLFTLDDTVEVFNLVLGMKLTEGETKDLLAFLRAL